MIPSQTLFRAYDIRGIYREELDAEGAFLIGKGFASYVIKHIGVPSPKLVVGRDNRIHSEELQAAFIRGLVESGCHVTNLGLAPTPYFYFADTFGRFDGGCNVTASHNPAEYNGFKLDLKDAHALFGEELKRVHQIIQRRDFIEGRGTLEKADFTTEYLEKFKDVFVAPRPLRVVVDTANGVPGLLYPQILKALGHEVIGLYTESDGTFPNHEPDPIVEKNVTVLKQKVLEHKADLGLAFDGDGDRFSLVTEKGAFVNADRTFMLLAKDALSRHPGRAVVLTVANSQFLFNLIEEWGGKPTLCKVGHSYVEDAVTHHKAIMGGEQSGHYFMPEDYYNYDDALAAASRLLKVVSQSGKPASTLFEDFPLTFAEPEIRPTCADTVKFDLIQRVADHFVPLFPSLTLDGVRIDFGNGGWAGIRASNTAPKLSITMEAKSPEELAGIRQTVLDHLKTYPEIFF